MRRIPEVKIPPDPGVLAVRRTREVKTYPVTMGPEFEVFPLPGDQRAEREEKVDQHPGEAQKLDEECAQETNMLESCAVSHCVPTGIT